MFDSKAKTADVANVNADNQQQKTDAARDGNETTVTRDGKHNFKVTAKRKARRNRFSGNMSVTANGEERELFNVDIRPKHIKASMNLEEDGVADTEITTEKVDGDRTVKISSTLTEDDKDTINTVTETYNYDENGELRSVGVREKNILIEHVDVNDKEVEVPTGDDYEATMRLDKNGQPVFYKSTEREFDHYFDDKKWNDVLHRNVKTRTTEIKYENGKPVEAVIKDGDGKEKITRVNPDGTSVTESRGQDPKTRTAKETEEYFNELVDGDIQGTIWTAQKRSEEEKKAMGMGVKAIYDKKNQEKAVEAMKRVEDKLRGRKTPQPEQNSPIPTKESSAKSPNLSMLIQQNRGRE